MKRIKAACITQTLCFSNHDGETTEYAKKAVVQEYEKYKEQLDNLEEDYIKTIDKVAGVIAQYGIALNKEGTTNQGSIQNTIETMVGNYPEDVKITILEKAIAKLIANI